MKRKSSILALLALLPLFLFLGCNKDNSINPNEPGITAETYIVALNLNNYNSVQSNLPVKDKIVSFIASHGIKSDKVSFVYDVALHGFAAQLTQDQLKSLSSERAVRYIEKDKIWTLDIPYLSLEGMLKGKNEIQVQSTPWGITAVGGTGTYRTGVKVWIIDTGIDLDHPDLNVDVTDSRSFVTGRESRSADDGNGHGSHVAGIIGAKDNSIGVVGVAHDVPVVAVKVLNSSGSGTTSAILAGLNYVAQNASSGDVANMSLGYNGIVTSVDEATYNCSNGGVGGGKNIFISIAAGNSGADASNYTPARIGLYYGTTLTTKIVSISACNSSYVFASWSNWGNPVEYCAPGVSIYSTYKDKGYATLSGTSMAAPHVAGIMACNGGPSTITSTFNVTGDPDGNADPFAHR